MTKREAAIVSTYTGIVLVEFTEAHVCIEEIMVRPVLTHKLANPEFAEKLKKPNKKDLVNIEIT